MYQSTEESETNKPRNVENINGHQLDNSMQQKADLNIIKFPCGVSGNFEKISDSKGHQVLQDMNLSPLIQNKTNQKGKSSGLISEELSSTMFILTLSSEQYFFL